CASRCSPATRPTDRPSRALPSGTPRKIDRTPGPSLEWRSMLEKGLGRAGWMAALVGLALVGPADAGTFRFQDAAGTVHYTNAPSDPRYQRVRGWPEAPASRS